MKHNAKLLIIAAFFVLAVSFMITGNASAIYIGDGAVQNGTTGLWDIGDYGKCVTGISSTGTIAKDATKTSRPDCLTKTYSAYTNAGTCLNFTNTESSSHFWASTCKASDGTVFSLTGLDRTTAMCEQTILKNGKSLPAWECVHPAYSAYMESQCTTDGLTWRNGRCVDTSKTQATCTGNATSTANQGACTLQNGHATSGTSLPAVVTSAACATAGGIWTPTTASTNKYSWSNSSMPSMCVGSWTYTGPADNGAPGFCYTRVTLAGYNVNTCPVSTQGYVWDTTNLECDYSYGIVGTLDGNIVAKDGFTITALRGTAIDLSTTAYDTQGECLAAGFSWSTGVPKVSTFTDAVDTSATLATVKYSRSGCLECHNNTSQNNGYAERWKSSYKMTGHKNMLRKVTAGKNWAGPDGVVYTAAATGAINFATAKATISGVDKDLLYIFGDWMAPAPAGLDVIVDNGSGAAKYNGANDYSCAPCHTTGWNRPDAGLCSLSSKTTSAACATAGGTWYTMNGVQGGAYTPAEPAASYPAVTFAGAGKWDYDGIMCSRCHASVFAQTGTVTWTTATVTWTSNAGWSSSTFKTPSPAFTVPSGTSTHNTTAANTANQDNTQVCFGCHQGIAKTNKGTGADADLSNAAIIPVKNNNTWVTSGTVYAPEFNGHVLGNSFLNSPHARYSPPVSGNALVPNSLGKYALVGNATSQYNSSYGGYICRSSTSAGSGNVISTVLKSGVLSPITSADDCLLANNVLQGGTCALTNYAFDPRTTTQAICTTAGGAWTASASLTYWQPESQGSCTTCHNVHDSLFDANAAEPVRRECAITCHTTKADLATIRHPMGTGTPLGNGTDPVAACETCHMPKATDGGFPMHLWRINTDPTYSTFPTKTQFYGGSCSNALYTKSSSCTSAGGTWTDASGAACSDGVSVTAAACDAAGKTWSAQAVANTSPDTSASNGVAYSGAVWVDLDAACGQCHGGSAGATATKNGAPYFDKTYLGSLATGMHDSAKLPPTVAHGTVTNGAPTTRTVSFTDTSTDGNGKAAGTLSIYINWGDGSVSAGAGGGTFSHTYANNGVFTILHKATDTAGLYAGENIPVTVYQAPSLKYSMTVTVYKDAAKTQLAAYAKLQLKNGAGVVVGSGYTNASGQMTFTNLVNSAYTVIAYVSGVDFDTTTVGKQSTSKPVAATISGASRADIVVYPIP